MTMENMVQRRSEAIYIVDEEGRIIHSCRNYADGGVSMLPEQGSICSVICHKSPCDKCMVQRALASGECEDQQRTADGGIVHVRIWPISAEILGKKFAIVFWQDISSQKNMEAQLYHSQKLEAIGELAAGVAHEINNPLGFIYGNLKVMQEYAEVFKKSMELMRQLGQTSPDKATGLIEQLAALDQAEDIETIASDIDSLLADSVSGAARVTEIVSNLKSFARPDSKEKRDYSVNDGLASTLKILSNELKYKCTVITDFGDVPDIECYPGELNQVFVNIIVNAAQAISDHGEIKIRTWAEQDNIYVEIADSGCGIKDSDLGHIFDPFFSTKPVGKGTGLGLSVSHGIVEKHGGRIEVKSELGVGTVFTIVLPAQRQVTYQK
ncbi:MAG: hypothetical protein JW745_07405 [Sedimentisphaerales bacterium]|nr:hypothetical protein [Sedimentisphaerales bacterium]